MAIHFLRRLSGKRRTEKANEHLGFALAPYKYEGKWWLSGMVGYKFF